MFKHIQADQPTNLHDVLSLRTECTLWQHDMRAVGRCECVLYSSRIIIIIFNGMICYPVGALLE